MPSRDEARPSINTDDQALRAARNVFTEPSDEVAMATSPRVQTASVRGRAVPSSQSAVAHDWFIPNDEAVMSEPSNDFMDEPDYGEEPDSFHEVRGTDFPAYDIPRWSMDEREAAVNTWFRQMEYRLKWIFYREEREGVGRLRFTQPFNPEDFKTRVEKSMKEHPMNTDTNKFYDWNIGGSDFVMRLELFSLNERTCLRCHFIYKPSELELLYQDRLWDGQFFREMNIVWANS